MLSTEQHRGADDSIHATRQANPSVKSKSEEQTDARRWRRTAILFVIGSVARRRSAVAIGIRFRSDIDVGSGAVVATTPMAAAVVTTVVGRVAAAVISAMAPA